MAIHQHNWYFSLAPAHWNAVCRCGLGVTVETPAPGQEIWTWRQHGEIPPAEVMLDVIESVRWAHRELMDSRRHGRN